MTPKPKKLAKPSVRIVATGALLAVAIPCVALTFEGENYSPPVAGRILAAGAAMAFVALAARAAIVGVLVSGDRVRVRNLFRTTDVDPGLIASISLPNRTPAEAIPKLQLRSGDSVGLLALSRTKNRLWGIDRTTERLVTELAALVGVPVIGTDERSRFRWG